MTHTLHRLDWTQNNIIFIYTHIHTGSTAVYIYTCNQYAITSYIHRALSVSIKNISNIINSNFISLFLLLYCYYTILIIWSLCTCYTVQAKHGKLLGLASHISLTLRYPDFNPAEMASFFVWNFTLEKSSIITIGLHNVSHISHSPHWPPNNCLYFYQIAQQPG